MSKILKKHKWAIAYLVAIFAAALFVIYQSYYRPDNPARFEVINFAGPAEILTYRSENWKDLERGQTVRVLDQIRTGTDGDADLRLPDQAVFRLGEDTELHGGDVSVFDLNREAMQTIQLVKGSLLVHVVKSAPAPLKLGSSILRLEAEPGSLFLFALETESDEPKAWVGVLRGLVKVSSKLLLRESVYILHPMEKTEATRGAPLLSPVGITRPEWNLMKEGYDLLERSAPAAEDQKDLGRKAGGFFEFVIDHGTFYTPNFGYATREFVQDANSGEVRMETEYDVFPTGSYVGNYFKTRELDAVRYSGLSFDARVTPEAGYPEKFKIELKSRDGIVKSYMIGPFETEWRRVELPWEFNRATPISEVTFVFMNQNVGEHKKGKVEFRNFSLKPAVMPGPQRAEAAQSPV